jgi:hypothetical protein
MVLLISAPSPLMMTALDDPIVGLEDLSPLHLQMDSGD